MRGKAFQVLTLVLLNQFVVCEVVNMCVSRIHLWWHCSCFRITSSDIKQMVVLSNDSLNSSLTLNFCLTSYVKRVFNEFFVQSWCCNVTLWCMYRLSQLSRRRKSCLGDSRFNAYCSSKCSGSIVLQAGEYSRHVAVPLYMASVGLCTFHLPS